MIAKTVSGHRAANRVVDILELVSASRDGLALHEVSAQLEAPKSSLLPLLRALTARGYLAQGRDGDYRLGLRIFELGTSASARRDLAEVARPELVELMRRTGETVFLGTLAGDGLSVVYIDKVESEQIIRYAAGVGDRRPLHATSSGKAILAFLPREQREKVLKALPLARHTERTVTSLPTLEASLEEIQRTGVCISLDEMVRGAAGVAAPIFDHRGAGHRGLRGRRPDRPRAPAGASAGRRGQADGALHLRAARLPGHRRQEIDREDIMRVGISLNMLTKEGRSDASVFAEHLALGDLAEPLGFDSVFALEHHFTGYAMSPSPTQLLSYIAGRTKRIILGTAVIVLPWHDPVRVAEQIALLDILSHGRCVFGFGRGAATVEYAGFRVPMEEARPRFVEAAKIVVKALTQDVFDWDGEFFKIPPTSIRPRPISHPERRFYASSVSPESAEIMAKLGFGLLVIMQNEWPKAAEDIRRYRDITESVGHTPRPPIISTNISVAESREEANERAAQYLARKWDSIDAHYHFSDGHLATVKGYEFYGGMAKTYSKMKDESFRKKATDFYVKIQVVGTPDDCIQQIAELHKLTGMDHLVGEFGYGGMPHEDAQLNMRMFAERVMPVLQRDLGFAAPSNGATATPVAMPGTTSIFAPA